MIVMASVFAIGEGEIVAIIMVIAVIAEVIAKWREAQAAAKKAKPDQPARPAGQDPVADEIGEFLRRASERRGKAGQRPARTADAPRPVRNPGRPVRPAQAEKAARPILVGEPDGGVAQHVQEHLKSTFKHLNPELGKEVAEADDKLDARLRQVFEHKVGRLSGLAGETAKPTTTDEPGAPPPLVPEVPLAQAVAGMFKNPTTVSQAIVLHEILRRPEERWNF